MIDAMDLLSKAIIAAVILALVVVGAYLYAQHLPPQTSLTKQQAVSLVQSDVEQNYPGAIINITNATLSQRYPGSWDLVVSIIVNSTQPCPDYFIYTYTYPGTGFVPDTQNTYTRGYQGTCSVNSSIIGAYPIAIAKSYTIHSSQIDSYINKFGYGNILATASYYPRFSVYGQNYTDIWLTTFTYPSANYSAYMVLSLEGTQLLTYTANK